MLALRLNGSSNEKEVSQLFMNLMISTVKMRMLSSVQMKKLFMEVKVSIEEGWFKYWERCNLVDS